MDPEGQAETRRRARVTGLVVNCPFGAPEADCPLTELRKKPLRERVIQALEMSSEELQRIEMHHNSCSARLEELNRCKPDKSA